MAPFIRWDSFDWYVASGEASLQATQAGITRFWALSRRPLPPSLARSDVVLRKTRFRTAQIAPSGIRSILRLKPQDDRQLLDGHLGAGVLEGLLDLRGLVLGNAFLDGLRSTFDEVLRFLQTERGDLADGLDDVDLLVACFLQDHRELGLLFDRRSGSGRTGSSSGRRGGGGSGNAKAIFERLDQVRQVENRHRLNLLHEIFSRNSHFSLQNFLDRSQFQADRSPHQMN